MFTHFADGAYKIICVSSKGLEKIDKVRRIGFLSPPPEVDTGAKSSEACALKLRYYWMKYQIQVFRSAPIFQVGLGYPKHIDPLLGS